MTAPLDRPPRPYADAPRLPDTGPVDVRSIFSAKTSRIEVEIGPGRGGFLLERLAAAPDVCLLGLEIRRKWAQIVDERIARAGLRSRGRVFAEDARVALTRLAPDASIAAFFFNFPDPWWKKRHQKRLVVQPHLLDAVARLLVPGGEIFFQTDVEERAREYEALLGADPRFAPAGEKAAGVAAAVEETPAAGIAGAGPTVGPSARMARNPYEATSHRERRAIADEIPIFRSRFVRAFPDGASIPGAPSPR